MTTLAAPMSRAEQLLRAARGLLNDADEDPETGRVALREVFGLDDVHRLLVELDAHLDRRTP